MSYNIDNMEGGGRINTQEVSKLLDTKSKLIKLISVYENYKKKIDTLNKLKELYNTLVEEYNIEPQSNYPSIKKTNILATLRSTIKSPNFKLTEDSNKRILINIKKNYIDNLNNLLSKKYNNDLINHLDTNIKSFKKDIINIDDYLYYIDEIKPIIVGINVDICKTKINYLNQVYEKLDKYYNNKKNNNEIKSIFGDKDDNINSLPGYEIYKTLKNNNIVALNNNINNISNLGEIKLPNLTDIKVLDLSTINKNIMELETYIKNIGLPINNILQSTGRETIYLNLEPTGKGFTTNRGFSTNIYDKYENEYDSDDHNENINEYDSEDQYYYAKYLKYKAKYIELKKLKNNS